MTVMKPGGAVGKILRANEINWVQSVLDDNPGLFRGFYDKSDETIFKTMWHGEFPGKLLAGIAQTYLLYNDEKTRRDGDEFVSGLKEAQEEDGYLGSWDKNVRFEKDVTEDNYGKWDTWGQYHCIFGLYRWYQVTGNKDAYHIAARALENIYRHFIEGGISIAAQNWAECNLAIGHAFALFYEETGDLKYLRAAERIVNRDWNDKYKDFYTKRILSCSWMKAALEGKAFYESGQLRWEGLYAIEALAVLYRATGKEEYKKAIDSLWRGMRDNDRHNTGSFGTGEGATGDIYGSGSETCNTVAWMALSVDYLKITGDSRIADELELSFYNAALGSLLEGERNFTYMNDSDGKREPARNVLEPHSYKGARDMSCCQANGNRGITMITEWALLEYNDTLYLNYFGESEMETLVERKYAVKIKQETDYPRSGNIEVKVYTDYPDELTLCIRIPSWSEKTVISLNDEKLSAEAGKYYRIRRKWKDSDSINLSFDMSTRFLMMEKKGAPFKFSAYKGPVLLAFRTSGGLSPSTCFNPELLRCMNQIEGEGIVNYEVRSASGERVILTDYYTAGKSGDSFVSWLSGENG